MTTVIEALELKIDQNELFAVTEEALHRFRNLEVVNRVSVVRGYADLTELYPDTKIYGRRLIDAIFRLAQSVDCHGDSVLADCLHRFVEGFESPLD